MSKTGDAIVLKINGDTNMYNAKPPMVIWMQAISISLFGPNEFAIRFPSAIAGLFICFIVLLFSERTLKNVYIGCLSVLILVSSQGFVRHHVTRTGDLDAVLVFWVTLYSTVAIHYILRNPGKYRFHFNVITIGVVGAFLSKSVAGLMPLAGLLIAAIPHNRLNQILKIKYLYYCAIFGLVACALFYLVREWISPGYLNVVLGSDYLRYFQNIMPWHAHPFYFYVQNWFVRDFYMPFIFVIPIAVYFAVRDKCYRYVSWILLLYCITYLVVISIPRVKLEWYDAALYPFMSLLVGIGLHRIGVIIKGVKRYGSQLLIVYVFLIIGILGFGYSNVIYNNFNNNAMPVDPLEREGYFIKYLHAKQPELKKYGVLMDVQHKAHLTQAKFYSTAYEIAHGYNIAVIDSLAKVQLNSTYISCQRHVIDSLTSQFNVSVLDSSQHNCYLLRIDERK